MSPYLPATKSKKRKRLASRPGRRLPPSWRNVLAVVGILSRYVVAQKSSATCTSGWNWLANKQNDSPCTIAAQLLALCDTKPASYELGSAKFYIPSAAPNSITPNTCSCNIVTYNLLMACQACQKGASPSDIPSWSQFGQDCTICSTETGIAPGPCGQQPNAGFPNSVHPEKGSVGVPLWAIENTSGSKWNPSTARRIAAQGGEKTIQAPNFAPNPETKSSGSNRNPNTESNQGNEKMKSAIIVCICLASVIAACFSMYLLRLYYKKRKEKRMREFGDSAFDKVVPTKKADSNSHSSENGQTTPMRLHLRKMVASLTIGLPKTPIFPKSPRTPGMAVKLPSTPMTARFWKFGRQDTKLVSRANENDESEYLAEKSVRFESTPGHDLRRQKAQSHRRESVASNYSDFDSYKAASSHTTTPRPGSVASVTSSMSRETLVTGSVKVEQPKLREAKRVDSITPLTSSVEHAPVRRSSQASIKSQDLTSGHSRSMPEARVKSQSVKVSEWSDRASVISQESRISKSTKSVRETAPRSRSASMSEAENRSGRDDTSARDSRIPRDSRRTKSGRSKARLNSAMNSDYQGSISDSDQRETIQFSEEMKAKQRETGARFSHASSSRSSTMEKSAGRMQNLFKTATEGLSDSNKTILDETNGDDDVSRDPGRASGVTVSSESSNLRRLDSVIGQLEFDEMMSAHGSPRKKSWFARMSTKSGRSVPPPSPAFSSAPGFAM